MLTWLFSNTCKVLLRLYAYFFFFSVILTNLYFLLISNLNFFYTSYSCYLYLIFSIIFAIFFLIITSYYFCSRLSFIIFYLSSYVNILFYLLYLCVFPNCLLLNILISLCSISMLCSFDLSSSFTLFNYFSFYFRSLLLSTYFFMVNYCWVSIFIFPISIYLATYCYSNYTYSISFFGKLGYVVK